MRITDRPFVASAGLFLVSDPWRKAAVRGRYIFIKAGQDSAPGAVS